MKRLGLAVLATVLAMSAFAYAEDAAVTVDPKIATMSNDELVAARQAAMDEDGKTLRGAQGATGDAAIAAATTILQNFTNFPALFKEGSLTDKSKAAAAIWQNWDDFNGLFVKGQVAAADMLAAAKAGDAAKYGTAFGTLAGLCKDCHETYRNR